MRLPILTCLVFTALSAPAFADDEALKLLFHNPVINATMSDTGTPDDPSTLDTGGPNPPPDDFSSHPWDDPANGYAPNSDGVSPLHDGDRCTGDSRCAGEPEVASGTGRGEQYYHYTEMMDPAYVPGQ